MGHRVDREMANSQRGTDLETEATRQSHYIKWTRIMGIPDPCEPHKGYQRIVVIYTKYLQSGINYYNKNNLQSAMLRGYATAVNMLFKLRKIRLPIDFNDKNNMAGVIINNIIKEENIAKQCALLDSTIFAKIQQPACKFDNLDSDHSLFSNIVTLTPNIGPRVSKYVQTTQLKVDYHAYPFGRQVIKAFFAKDFAFFNKSQCRLSTVDYSSFEVANTVRITWRIQKNCQNGQTIILSSDSAHPDLCPIRSILRMVHRARRLKHPDTMPLGCYRKKKSSLVYLTASRIAALIQEVVKKVRPGISAEDLSKYSAHLLQV
jgi:hypothetical protein